MPHHLLSYIEILMHLDSPETKGELLVLFYTMSKNIQKL